MFFLGCIHRVFSHQRHRLSTANELAAAGMKNLYNISTKLALVNFASVGHFLSPF
jgi:hypothetical protein